LLVAGGYAAYRIWWAQGPWPEGLIQANGRIEGETTGVATKFPGRVQQLLVREGETVAAGQVLAQLDDAQIQAKVMQARQAVAALESQLQAAETALSVFRREVPLSLTSTGAGVAHAQAVLTKADAADQQAARDAQRFRQLAERGSVGKQRGEQAQLASTAAHSDLEAARTGLTQAQQQLRMAELGRERIRAKQSEFAALKAQLNQARAALADAESVLADQSIKAPTAGTITTKVHNPGEVLAAGASVFELVDMDHLYLKVYVPEIQIGKLRLGLPAQIYVDAFPNQPFPATLQYIASTAEFTPKEVQTPDERVKLVYAVKLYLDRNQDHRLTPGLPADAVIRWKDGTPWAKPRY
jgi:HlyD family secretion protein